MKSLARAPAKEMHDATSASSASNLILARERGGATLSVVIRAVNKPVYLKTIRASCSPSGYHSPRFPTFLPSNFVAGRRVARRRPSENRQLQYLSRPSRRQIDTTRTRWSCYETPSPPRSVDRARATLDGKPCKNDAFLHREIATCIARDFSAKRRINVDGEFE